MIGAWRQGVKWITREHIRIDRCASAWLILRFVDAHAEFVFAPGAGVLARAQTENATPFHVPGCELGQADGKTGFDAILQKFGLTDPGLHKLATWVRAADGKDNAPEGPGIAAMSRGFAMMKIDDHENLRLQLPMWEALYQFCK